MLGKHVEAWYRPICVGAGIDGEGHRRCVSVLRLGMESAVTFWDAVVGILLGIVALVAIIGVYLALVDLLLRRWLY